MAGYANEDEVARALEELTGGKTDTNDKLVPPGQRPCPICGQMMAVEARQGVSIDVCAAHGMWLDNGELRPLVELAASKGRLGCVEMVRRARREGKVSGAMFGLWSLLFD